ncbi:MAG: GntR family transcriptional regulator [Planctomycetaceae bacterium]|nr:GntR family transcriptional regulator [Planctomycetaceae bacterium]
MTSSPLNFEIQPSSGMPIYRQLMEQVRALVASGRLEPGDYLPSVRQMAGELDINMMTVSKAYARLEAEGVVERERGLGMRVTNNVPQESAADRKAELREHVEVMVTRAKQLGLTDDQIQAVVKSVLKEWPS